MTTRFNVTTALSLALLSVPVMGSERDAAAQPPTVPDAPSAPLTLRDALVMAYDNNPALDSERSRLRSLNERYVQARAQYGPTLSVQGSYGYAHDRIGRAPSIFDPSKNFRDQGFSGQASAIVTQPLFTAGRLKSIENLTYAGVMQGREQLRLAEIQTMQTAIGAYIGVLLDKSLLDISLDNMAILDRQRREGRIRFGVREITATDFEQIVSQAEFARARVELARGSLVTSQSQFLQVIGAVPGDLASLPPLPPLPATIEDAYAMAEKNNPELLATRAQERASRAQVQRVKGENGPQVRLQGEATYGSTGNYNMDPTQTLMRGRVIVDMPLFTSGLNQAREREARHNNEADWRLADQALRDVRQQVAQSWEGLIAARTSIAAFRESAAAAQRAYEGAEIQQKAGDRSTKEVLDLARDMLQARSQLASAQASEYVNAVRLLAVTGELDLASLVPDAKTYDVEKEFRKTRHDGDVLPVTQIVRTVDGLLVPSNRKDKPSRDPAADVRLPGAEMPPALENQGEISGAH
jgi:TolC family type I secretion outer membrane protein